MDRCEAAERVHDSPYRSEQTNIRTHRCDAGKEGQVGFELFFFSPQSHTHGTLGTVHHGYCVDVAFLPKAGKFLEASAKDIFHSVDPSFGTALTEQLT